MKTKSITRHELDFINNYIEKEVYELRSLGIQNQEVFIAIPNWIKTIITLYCRERFSRVFYNDLNKPTYFGVNVQNHYKDEIVVFYKDYHVNPELFAPKIYEIKIETVEK